MKFIRIIDSTINLVIVGVISLIWVIMSSMNTDENYTCFISVNPIDENSNPVQLTRAQFMTLLIEHDQMKRLVKLNDEVLDSIINELEYISDLDYDSSTLALKWKVTNDTIISLQYIAKPVIGVIYINPNDSARAGYYSPTVIWITNDFTVDYKSNEYNAGPYLKDLVLKYRMDIIVPKELLNNSIVSPMPEHGRLKYLIDSVGNEK